ncbi:MAG TPA: histidine kinase dimerization/phospho-acceptor domain-containing protein [Anaerolineae bacterium]
MNEHALTPLHIAHFVSALSHELRAPLASIKGAATTLSDYRLRLSSDQIDGFLTSIDAESDRLTDMLNSLVELARIQLGLLPLHRTRTSLIEVIQQALAARPDQTLSLDGPDVMACIDAVRIRQVFSTLITHTPVRITLVAEPAQVTISIHDAASAASLVDTLELLDHPEHLREPGRRRLVLPMMQLMLSGALIDLHGGQLWLGSEAGPDRAICFSLPLAGPDDFDEDA